MRTRVVWVRASATGCTVTEVFAGREFLCAGVEVAFDHQAEHLF